MENSKCGVEAKIKDLNNSMLQLANGQVIQTLRSMRTKLVQTLRSMGTKLVQLLMK